MKRIILLLTLAIMTIGTASAQLDIKVGPLGFVFSNLNLGIEYGATPNFGIEVTPGIDWKSVKLRDNNPYKATILRLGLNGRYYFNPNDKGLNGFYAGLYTRYSGGTYSHKDSDTKLVDEIESTRFAGGFLMGGKIVAGNERIIFDLGIGLGRAFVFKFEDQNGSDSVDLSNVPFLRFDMPINLKIGYRFGLDSK